MVTTNFDQLMTNLSKKSLFLYAITAILVNNACLWNWLKNSTLFNVFVLIY